MEHYQNTNQWNHIQKSAKSAVKVAVAISGASGAVYAKVLLDKLVLLKDQYEEVSIVMSNNAKEIWKTELGNEDYNHYPFRHFDKYDFFGTLCFWLCQI